MFRDKPSAYESAYDRVSSAISDIGERIADLEERVVERLNPTPPATERLRRAIVRNLPGQSHHRVSRYLPDFVNGWSLPSFEDARSSLKDWKSHLPDLHDSLDDAREVATRQGREARNRAASLGSALQDVKLPRIASLRREVAPRHGFAGLQNRSTGSTVLIAGGVILAVGAAVFVTRKIAEHTEEPDYEVVRKDGAIEIRDYDAMVIAETVKSGYHETARRAGFSTLADYIFANNRSGRKIPMTAPVLQQLSESEGQTKGWAIRFVMPKRYLKTALPEPASNDVALKDVASKRVVAIRFPGSFNATIASKRLMDLYNYIADENLKQKGDPEYAFYNPPWTPGFLRRNEILIEIER